MRESVEQEVNLILPLRMHMKDEFEVKYLENG